MKTPSLEPVIIRSLQYGPTEVTDQKAWAFVAACIENYTPLRVTNMSMGGDTHEGHAKTARVVYTFNGLTKVREAAEYDWFHFDRDIVSIAYGADGIGWLTNDYYKNKVEQLADFYRAFDLGRPFHVHNGIFLLSDDDDPASNHQKKLKVEYYRFKVPGRNVADGMRGRDWEWDERSADEYKNISFENMV